MSQTPMTTMQLLSTAWVWDPVVVAGCAGLVVAYLWAVPRRERETKHTIMFVTGVAVLLLSLVSPVDTLGDSYLFSAHMTQHLMMELIVPPLLVLGLPPELMRRALGHPVIGRVERVLRLPALAWVLAMGALWLWHIPALYNAALANENIHIVQHLTFLVTSTIFWWPVLTTLEECRYGAAQAVAYLGSAAAASVVLGMILTFAPAGIYPAYLNPDDKYNALSLIRNQWGFTPAVDQQVGGTLMWVPGGLAYLIAILGVFARWVSAPETDEELSTAGGKDYAI